MDFFWTSFGTSFSAFKASCYRLASPSVNSKTNTQQNSLTSETTVLWNSSNLKAYFHVRPANRVPRTTDLTTLGLNLYSWVNGNRFKMVGIPNLANLIII